MVLVLACCVGLAAPVAAQVYRWVDKDGKVHYSDKAPRDGTQAKDLAIESKPTDPAAVEQEQATLQERGASVDQSDAVRKMADAKAAAEKADRERRCANARADMNVLERANRLVTVDADNQERIATDAEFAARRERARQRVAELCD